MDTLLKIIFISIMLLYTLPTLADTLVTKDGKVIEGKIVYCIGSMVSIKTKDGVITINRNLDNGQARDIIEVGLFRKKKLSGEVQYLDEDVLDLGTSKGKISIKRRKIRSITLSHENKL